MWQRHTRQITCGYFALRSEAVKTTNSRSGIASNAADPSRTRALAPHTPAVRMAILVVLVQHFPRRPNVLEVETAVSISHTILCIHALWWIRIDSCAAPQGDLPPRSTHAVWCLTRQSCEHTATVNGEQNSISTSCHPVGVVINKLDNDAEPVI